MARKAVLAVGIMALGGPGLAEVIDLSATGLAEPERTLDFSRPSFPEFTQITDQFAAFGVSFDPHLVYRLNDHADWGNVSGPNLRSGDPIIRTFSLRFDPPRSSAAVVAIAQPPTPATFTAKFNGLEVESFQTDVTITNRSNYFGFEEIVFDEIEISYTAETRMRIDNLQLGAAVELEGPRLEVATSGDDLVLSWESEGGKLYNLRSETDPSNGDPESWPIFDGKMDLEATPPMNTLTVPLPADPLRLFVVEEFPAPPMAVLSDDFESGQGDWTTGSAGADGTAWELGMPTVVGPAAAHSPVNCFGTNLAGEYGMDAEVWLRSPAIDLTTAGGATLNYFQFVDIEEGFDFGTVRVLDATDESELAEIESPVDGAGVDWEKVTKRLPAAALGKTVVIEFRLISDDIQNFAGWYIDDVEVTVP